MNKCWRLRFRIQSLLALTLAIPLATSVAISFYCISPEAWDFVLGREWSQRAIERTVGTFPLLNQRNLPLYFLISDLPITTSCIALSLALGTTRTGLGYVVSTILPLSELCLSLFFLGPASWMLNISFFVAIPVCWISVFVGAQFEYQCDSR